jgi:hypothetical protein
VYVEGMCRGAVGEVEREGWHGGARRKGGAMGWGGCEEKGADVVGGCILDGSSRYMNWCYYPTVY